jgi:hypothetical protein
LLRRATSAADWAIVGTGPPIAGWSLPIIGVKLPAGPAAVRRAGPLRSRSPRFFDERGERDVPVEANEWGQRAAVGVPLPPRRPELEATQALRQVLARAVVWGMIDANPAKLRVDNQSPRRREQRPVESWAGLDAVATKLSARYRLMVIFAAHTDPPWVRWRLC